MNNNYTIIFSFRYCTNGDLVALCPEGHYCPAGTGSNWQPCPPGSYNNNTGLSSSAECSPCPGGYYCNQYGLSEPSGPCDPGYYCEFGVDRARPTATVNITSINGTCQLLGKFKIL